MICGNNKHDDVALEMAGLTDKNLGRYRDAYFEMKDDELIVVVYTRNGCGNRDCIYDDSNDSDEEKCEVLDTACYGCVITRADEFFPNFISDKDDDFDCT